MLNSRRPSLFENGKPVVVDGESLQLERHRRRGWGIAGARFEGPELEGRLVELRQRERPERFGGRRQDLCGRLHLFDPGPAAIASSRGDDAFSPRGQPFEQDHSVSRGNGPRENGVFVARFGTAEIDVENDASGILLDEAFGQARMDRARPVMRHSAASRAPAPCRC